MNESALREVLDLMAAALNDLHSIVKTINHRSGGSVKDLYLNMYALPSLDGTMQRLNDLMRDEDDE